MDEARAAEFANRIHLLLITNPWYDRMAMMSFSLLAVGVLLMWIYRRVNDSRLYFQLSVTLLANGAFTLLFFRSPFPATLFYMVEATLAYLTFIYVTALLTTVLLKHLPDYGVEEKALFDPDTHVIRPWVVPGLSFILLVVLWFVFPGFFILEGFILGDFLPWLVLVGSLGLFTVAISPLIPYHQVRETALLGESAPPRELTDVLEATGPASRMEKIAAPVLCLTAWAILHMLASGSGSLGYLFLFLLLGGSIARTEMSRARRAEMMKEGDKKDRKPRLVS